MDEILNGLRESMRQFPKCRVASCECDDSVDEWKLGCNCPGHWQTLSEAFGDGKGDWSLADAAASAKVGKAIRADKE